MDHPCANRLDEDELLQCIKHNGTPKRWAVNVTQAMIM